MYMYAYEIFWFKLKEEADGILLSSCYQKGIIKELL
jgi:hypothetical protein